MRHVRRKLRAPPARRRGSADTGYELDPRRGGSGPCGRRRPPPASPPVAPHPAARGALGRACHSVRGVREQFGRATFTELPRTGALPGQGLAVAALTRDQFAAVCGDACALAAPPTTRGAPGRRRDLRPHRGRDRLPEDSPAEDWWQLELARTHGSRHPSLDTT